MNQGKTKLHSGDKEHKRLLMLDMWASGQKVTKSKKVRLKKSYTHTPTELFGQDRRFSHILLLQSDFMIFS